MGNKIITEKDFWTCTGGLMPTQFQSGQSVAKKKSGEKYITKMDTATVSFADFSCKKLMFIMAILAAVIAVAVVATGGAALIAIGALAGAAGAAFGAVLGSLLCGQMVAKVRQWLAGKENFKIMGIPTITGDHLMLCPLFGDQITFAPEIKTWGQALAKGGANLVGGIMEGMMAGALIGTGGALLKGGQAALTSGGLRGLGQAGVNFLKSAPSNIMSNFGQGLFNGVGFKLVDGATNWLNTYGDTGQASADDFRKGVRESTFGDAAAIKSILTTGGTMQDWVAAAMLLTPGGKKGKGNHNPHSSHITTPDAPHGNKPHGDADGNGKPKDDGGGKKQEGDDGSTPPRSHAADAPNAGKRDGKAFADGGDATIKPPEFETITLPDGRKVKRLKPNSDYQSNGYNYKTDSDGRIIEVNGTLRQEKGGRSNHHQRTVGKNDGRLDTDHGGHLIGDQFGGSGGKDNLVPMDKDVNNYHKGEWGQMEKNWADELKNGKEVDIKIEPRYEGNSGRPSHFDITETITPPGIPKNITIFN